MNITINTLDYLVSQDKKFLKLWFEGTKILSLEKISPILNITEIMNIQTGIARLHECSTEKYEKLKEFNLPTKWLNYVEATGRGIYFNEINHAAFSEKQNPGHSLDYEYKKTTNKKPYQLIYNEKTNYKNIASIEELFDLSPFNPNSINERLRIKSRYIKALFEHDKKSTLIYVPGPGVNFSKTVVKKRRKQYNISQKQKLFFLHKIREELLKYPDSNLKNYRLAKEAYEDENEYYNTTHTKSPRGYQTRLYLNCELPKNTKIMKSKKSYKKIEEETDNQLNLFSLI
ncbi:MAG: hypothetical protein ACMXX6_01460 [Candidatus Woesearchaeota archaeon]